MSFAKLPVLRHGLMVRHEDILPDAAITRRIADTRQLMQERDVKSLMVYSDAATSGPVCYLTNYPCYGHGRRATVVLGLEEGPFLFTGEPSRNLPRVRRFIACDIEKTRQFIPGGCERAKRLAGGGAIGLVNGRNIAVGSRKDFESQFAGIELRDLSQDFAAIVAAKDNGGLTATTRAIELARQGIETLSGELRSGKDLWQLGAYADYRLRLEGCEDTNILLGCVQGGKARPGYPSRMAPDAVNGVVTYVAVQYARHWGVVGRTLSIEKNNALETQLGRLADLQESVAAQVKVGMTLGDLRASVMKTGGELGLAPAQDLPIVSGVGFDLKEYPTASQDLLKANMVLQSALAVDVDGSFTAMLVDMLQVTDRGGVWLTRGETDRP